MSIETIKLADKFSAIVLRFNHQVAIIALQGAQLISYKDGGVERLWLSPATELKPNKAIRGGVPICWPWFGNHPDSDLPAHGLVRTALWRVVSSEDNELFASVTLSPQFDLLKSPHLPKYVDLSLTIKIDASALELTLTTHNHSDQTLCITEALHTYLPVSDLDAAYLSGLKDCIYADKLADYAEQVDTSEQRYLNKPTDRVYFDDQDYLELIDTRAKLKTHIAKTGSKTTVIWNPGAEQARQMSDLGEAHYRQFICVEAANALNQVVSIPPHQTNSLSQRLSWYDI